MQFFGDCVAETDLAAIIRIAGAAIGERAIGGFDDVLRRAEIGLAAHERDQLPAFRLELAHLTENGIDSSWL